MFAVIQIENLLSGMTNSTVFGLMAVIMLGIGCWIFDKWILHGIDIQAELKKGNTAVAIVMAGFLLALGLIIFGVTN
jgi:uncharacterized membrane protein YjfL (UPF0719 family)